MSTTTTTTTTTSLILSPVIVSEKLDPLPFWKTKPKVYQSMIEERRIICSAKTDKVDSGQDKGKYELNIVAAGLVRAPLKKAWEKMKKFESLKQVDSRFQEVKYFPENQRLFLHLVAYGFHAQMILQMRYGEGTNANEMHFESVEGSFKGMKGVVRIEKHSDEKSEIAMTTDYSSETIPLPRILLGVGVEIIGTQVAKAMRSFLENE